IEERLPHVDRVRLLGDAYPVGPPLRRTQNDLEAAVRLDLEIPAIEMTGFSHRAVDGVAVRACAEGDVVHGAAVSVDPVLATPVDGRVEIQVVRVVAADLGRLVTRHVEGRKVG